MKIIVKTEELKQEILKQSEKWGLKIEERELSLEERYDWFIKTYQSLPRFLIGLDSDKAGILMHLYMTPQIIEVEQ